MPTQKRFDVPRIILSTGMANVVLGCLVATIYFYSPKYGYFVFAAYYALMTYEFYEFLKSNWDTVMNESKKVQAPTKKKFRWRGRKHRRFRAPPSQLEFPPPVDTDDEQQQCVKPEENNDIVTVDMPDSWDPSAGSDDDDGYYDATRLILQCHGQTI